VRLRNRSSGRTLTFMRLQATTTEDTNFHITAFSINALARAFGLAEPMSSHYEEWVLDTYRMDALMKAAYAASERSVTLRRIEDAVTGQGSLF
jgi:hypothetical protein